MDPYVHDTLTREWVVRAGLADIAAEVAQANVALDHLYPGRFLLFSPQHLGPSAALIARWRLAAAIRRRSPRLLGRALHGIQDFHSHGWLGEKHMQYRFRMLRRHPDDWEAAPDRVKRRIEAATASYLRRYRAKTR